MVKGCGVVNYFDFDEYVPSHFQNKVSFYVVQRHVCFLSLTSHFESSKVLGKLKSIWILCNSNRMTVKAG